MKLKLRIIYFISFLCLVFIPTKQVKASWIKEESNPILKIDDSIDWMSQKIYGQSVVFDTTTNKLWFSGSNNAKRQIGYADSSSSINWVKYENPVISWDKINDQDVGVEHSTIIYNSSSPEKYKIWFNNVLNFSPFFRLYYGTSNDGSIWSLKGLIFLNNNSGWDSMGNTAPSVIFDQANNLYKMWYTGNGVFNDLVKWRIGYATSSDGINWQKHPFPVLDADQAWERVAGDFGIGNPSVFYENGLYHLFYHADRDIGHAVSYNGISWTKNPENPVLRPELTNNQAFDQRRVMDPFVINNEGTYYMYYTGVRGDGKWQIGLATSTVLPTVIPPPENSPTPTPTLSPTPTLTPTPSLTPTPTPTITPGSIIVIVPGLGASWNTKDIFSCNLNTTGEWKLAPFVSAYKPLVNTLAQYFSVFLYTYDWRQPLEKQSLNLKNYLEKILIAKPPGTKVKFIGHSFGGLVVRSYLTDFPEDARVEKIITVGTPHKGIVLAYPLWEKGEVWSDDKLLKIVLTQLINHCRIVRNPLRFQSPREVIRQLSPSVKDLLPVFDYLKSGNQLLPSSGLKSQNDWLNNHASIPANYLQFLDTLSGKGYNTLRLLDIEDPSSTERKNGDWIDGKPVKKIKSNDGDNTVLTLSSSFAGVQNELIDGNHLNIISTPFAINKILSLLSIKPLTLAEEFIPENISRDALIISISLPTHLEITDPKRKSVVTSENIAVLYQPTAGLYRLKITPNETGTATLHVFYISDFEESKNTDFQIRVTKGKTFNYLLPITSFQKPLPQIISIKN